MTQPTEDFELEDQAAVVRRLKEELNIALTEKMDAFADVDRLRTAFKEFLSTHKCKYPAECSDCDDAHKEVGR